MPHQSEVIGILAGVARASGAALPQQTVCLQVRSDIATIRGELQDSVGRRQEKVKRLLPQVRRMAGVCT